MDSGLQRDQPLIALGSIHLSSTDQRAPLNSQAEKLMEYVAVECVFVLLGSPKSQMQLKRSASLSRQSLLEIRALADLILFVLEPEHQQRPGRVSQREPSTHHGPFPLGKRGSLVAVLLQCRHRPSSRINGSIQFTIGSGE